MIFKRQQQPDMQRALRDHSLEGIAVLVSEPSQLLKISNLLILVLVLAALAWAWFAKADVLVKAPGVLAPKADIRRVYVPIDGELVDIYVNEGLPVKSGDIVARINARGAIESASKVLEANLQLDRAQLEFDNFPNKKQLMETKAEALRKKLEFQQQKHNRRMAEGIFKLAGAQRARLQEMQAALTQAQRLEDNALLEYEKYERLSKLAGGGGVSKSQVRQKNSVFLDAKAKTQAAQAKLTTLEFEIGKTLADADAEFAASTQELAELRIQFESTIREIGQEQKKLEFQLRSARIAAEAAKRVSFDNFDENNFLKIFSPVTGVVTEVPKDQRGDKIGSNRPLLSVAPSESEKIVNIDIAESDRGFLAQGLAVKLKFNAFPYQRYGSIEGILEYISPNVVKREQSGPPTYLGRVRLLKDSVTVNGAETPLRYGMGAVAEIVVRERRLIDLALEPFRNI
jgi:HlyD family secretion protein